MFHTARNILSTTEDKKREFVLAFSKQTTENDRKLGEIFATDDINFGTAFVTLIRLALSHVQDNTAEIHSQLDNFINQPSQRFTTNTSSSFPLENSPPPFPIPISATNINKPKQDVAQNSQ